LWHACFHEPLALTQLRRRERRRFGRDRVRERQALGHASRDRHGPVDARGDQPLDTLRARQPFDAGLVLGRDDRAAVGVAKAGCGRIAVDGDHVQLTCTRRGEQPELGRPRA
jgi:hypothetical protein